MKNILFFVFFAVSISFQAHAFQTSSPELLTDDISVTGVMEIPSGAVRISYNKANSTMYLVLQNGNMYRLNLSGGFYSTFQNSDDHGLGDVQGMDISDNGIFYIVGNNRDNANATNTATIMRGEFAEEDLVWTKVAETEPYPLSNTAFDHIVNAIVVSPDQKTLYVNSGSRTDHGEVHSVDGLYPDLREAPLTAKILQIPADTTDLILQNDLNFLRTNDFVYAEGTRNSFSLEFDAEGNLFGTENAGDRDDPEELNWLRKDHHYGFPWVIGGNETPMQFDGYNWQEDSFVDPNSTAANGGFFYNDPDYPAPPENVTFTSAVLNTGTDSDNYRDPVDAQIKDASEQDTMLTTFVSHLSPLGLVFDTEGSMGNGYQNDGFLLGFSSTTGGAFLIDRMDYIGGNLIHVELTMNEAGDNFEAKVTSLVRGFFNPIDAEIIGNKIYLIEYGNDSWLNVGRTKQLYEITFPEAVTSTEENNAIATDYRLGQNYPNPFNPSTVISYELSKAGFVNLDVFNSLGQKVETLVSNTTNSGSHSVTFDASALSSGVYFYTLRVDGQFIQTRKMLLIK